MKNWLALCVVAAASVFFVNTKEADAAAANNTYVTYVVSSVSGEFGAVLTFTNNSFVLVAEDGSLGGGSFTDGVVFTRGLGISGGYVGTFTAIASPNLIIGVGVGTAGDTFFFIGL